jgi:hypothetical protein
MNNTTIKPLSFKEICGIIETCGKNQVTELKFGDLQITFRPRAQSHEASQIPIHEQVEPTVERSAIFGGQEQALETEEAKTEYEEALRQAEELITDPTAHELAMIEQATKE